MLYPYGYGLSYTKFAFGRPEIKVFDNIAKISVDVTNTGSREGADVVQLYVGCEGSTVDRPVKTLRDFQRVDLNAGETRRVDLSVSLKDMAYFSEKEDCFVTENIKYIAYVGDSSRSEDLQKIEFVFE